jgi:hypothetical protein
MTKMKKLALYAFVLVLMLSAAVTSATSALYTSSDSNDGNSFDSGTLVISQQRNNDSVTTSPMFYGDPTKGVNAYTEIGMESVGGMAPGDRIKRSLVLTNNGSLDGKVTKLFANVTSGDTNPGYKEFTRKLNVKVIKVNNRGSNSLLYSGPLSTLLTENGFSIPANKVFNIYSDGGTAALIFKVKLAKSAGNDLQGQTYVFDFSIFAEQLKNN